MRTLLGSTKMPGAFLGNRFIDWAQPEAQEAPSQSLSHRHTKKPAKQAVSKHL